MVDEVRFAVDSPLEEEGFEPSVPRERVCAFRDMFAPCDRSGARYRSKWYIDDSDGALLFGLGIHGQYLFVDAEKLVVANVSSGELPLNAAHNRDIAGCISDTARPGWLTLRAKRSRATVAYAAAVPAGGSNGPLHQSRPR